MLKTKTLPLLLALAILPASEFALAAAPAATPGSAPLVKQGGPGLPARPPTPALAPPKPTLYDPTRADPMKAPPALPSNIPNLPRPGSVGPGGMPGMMPGMPGMMGPGMDPYSVTPEQEALARARTEGKYLGTMGNERVWRHNNTLYFEKIEQKKD